MSSFNTVVYENNDSSYNVSYPMYIDGSGAQNIPLDGNDYLNKFGQIMAAFVVDKGDCILGGNVLISEQLSVFDKLHIYNDISVNGVYITPNELSYLDGATSNLQTQISLKAQTGSTGATGQTGPAT